MAKKKKVTKSGSGDIDDGKVCAVLAYFLVGIIWFFVDDKMKKNNFVKHHVKQAIVLMIVSIVYSIVLSILLGILVFPLMFLGAVGMIVMGVFSLLYWIPPIIGIFGIVHAVQGNTKDLPVIGKFAKKLKF